MKQFYKINLIILMLLTCLACEEFVSIDLPSSRLTTEAVFQNDATATAAALGMYESMLRVPSFSSSGSPSSIATIGGIYSDEMTNFLTQNSPFAEAHVEASNASVLSIWSTAYYTLFTANRVLEGSQTGSVSYELQKQLKGEALFIRAFCHFYLVNLFGSIPLVTTTDYRANATQSRNTEDEVYDQILDDLTEAVALLPKNYVSAERTRPNSWSAAALLARVYLYRHDWSHAEAMASEVIAQGNLFALESDLDKTFLKGSREAIWQLSSTSPTTFNTTEGTYFILTSPPTVVALSSATVESFDDSDKRLSAWVGTYTSGESMYRFVNKYKIKGASTPLSEHSIVLRLAEQYLIRAEARLHLGNLTGEESAVSDINIIRARAGLSETTASTDADIMSEIQNERRHELFGEWAHRWFDLKRTGKASEVLSVIKPNWDDRHTLLPIPESEILSNKNLLPQNPGY